MNIDEHEEEFLDLPEINRRQIDDNKYDILQNRIMLVSLFILLLVMTVGSHVVLSHSLHDCENRLYTHLVESGGVEP